MLLSTPTKFLQNSWSYIDRRLLSDVCVAGAFSFSDVTRTYISSFDSTLTTPKSNEHRFSLYAHY